MVIKSLKWFGILVLSLAVTCCTAGEDDAQPSTGGSGTTTTPDQGDDDDDDQDDNKNPLTLLAADGRSTNTYNLIEQAGYGIESPDYYGVHTAIQHIDQRWDAVLGKNVFDFIIHIKEDDDRGIATTTDRQRNEIKTDSKSPDHLLAFEGDKVTYQWYMLLPIGMLTTTAFTHIHQVKGIDNSDHSADVGNPTITFTTRTRSSVQQFEVRFTPPIEEGGKYRVLTEAPLSNFIGQWVKITETIQYSTNGSYTLYIERVSNSSKIISFTESGLNMIRTGSPASRPKWGIYRNFGSNGSNKHLLRDEVLSFADFSIVKH